MSNIYELVSIDSTGNLYIGDYWVYINKDDDLDFMKINNLSFEKPDKIISIKNQNLKAKMIDDEIENVLKSGDGNNFIDEDDENNVNFYVNNPETKYGSNNNRGKNNNSNFNFFFLKLL